MEISDRQREILETARTQGRVSVEGLAGDYSVTPQTIRRDLNELCTRGLLSRVHGGAVPAHSVSNFGYAERRALAADAKRRIGEATARLIPEHCSLFINLGTTTEQVARALFDHRDLAVITNNINVVNLLSGSPEKQVIIAGGVVRPTDGGIVGEATVDFIRQFKVDFAVIGASALDQDGSILDFDYREVKVAQAILENARRTILVADHLKFSRAAPVRIAHVSRLERIVTDQPPPPAFTAICRNHGVAIEIAGGA
ncbi:MAG: DeoR/GlpR family DNA-binding transcription regulator [Pseudomonadota bacterium]